VNVEGAPAEALNGRQNVVGRLGPAQRLRVVILVADEHLDGRDQLLDRRKSRSSTLSLIALAFLPFPATIVPLRITATTERITRCSSWLEISETGH
jgi:hypothetical protein